MKILSIIVGVVSVLLAVGFYAAGVAKNDPYVVYHLMFWTLCGGALISIGLFADTD